MTGIENDQGEWGWWLVLFLFSVGSAQFLKFAWARLENVRVSSGLVCCEDFFYGFFLLLRFFNGEGGFYFPFADAKNNRNVAFGKCSESFGEFLEGFFGGALGNVDDEG